MSRPLLVRRHQGFSILEMALVLIVLGVLAMAAVRTPPDPDVRLRQMLINRAQDSLYAYVLDKGNLPCADLNGDGVQDCIGVSQWGDLPWLTLGVEPQEVQAPWALKYLPHSALVHDPHPADWTNIDRLTGPLGGFLHEVQSQAAKPRDSEPYLAQLASSGQATDCGRVMGNLAWAVVVVDRGQDLQGRCVLPPAQDSHRLATLTLGELQTYLLGVRP